MLADLRLALRSLARAPAIRRALLGTALALVSLGSASAASPGAAARKYYHDASGAFEDQNYEAALGLMEKAAALRPDQPRYLGALARLQAMNDRPLDAITTLNRLARMGVFLDPTEDDSFASLQGYAAFGDVLQQLRANRDPLGSGTVLFELPGMTGIIEGIAFRPRTGEYFFSDVRHRCVWVRRTDGSVHRFSSAGAGLLAVLGLGIDETRGALWAATSAAPEMEDYRPADRNRAALVEFALADGAVRRVAPLPADGAGHGLGDLAVAADGTVYATDRIAPVIWRLAPGSQTPASWVKSDEFASLQGLALAPDGKALLVADSANGLFHIDLATRTVRALEPPPETTLVGIDALVVAPDGTVLAVQNGIEPRRVVRVWPDPAWRRVVRLDVLERGHPAMADPTLGALVGDRFVFVGAAGWDRFAAGGPADPAAPRAVPILATRLPAAARDP